MTEYRVVTTVEATLTEHWIVDAESEDEARAMFANGELSEVARYDGQEEEDHHHTRVVHSVTIRKKASRGS